MQISFDNEEIIQAIKMMVIEKFHFKCLPIESCYNIDYEFYNDHTGINCDITITEK